MRKKEVPKFQKERVDKNNNRTVIVVAIVLIILLVVLVYFFAHKYFLTKKQISSMFENMKEVEPDTEFETGLFSSLKDACIGKEIGESCNYEFHDETKNGVCSLSGNNETVCIAS